MRPVRTRGSTARSSGIPEQNDATKRGFLSVVGLVFLSLLFVAALLIPQPTLFQVNVFKTLLALFAAGIGALIPGFIEVDYKPYIRAGGALALFVIVYFFDPAGYTADEVTVYVPGRLLPQERPVSNPTKDTILRLKELLSETKDVALHPDTIEALSRCMDRPKKCTVAGFSDATIPPVSLPTVDVSEVSVPGSIQTFGDNAPIIVGSDNVTITINQR